MRRVAGTLLVALSVLFAAGTVLVMVLETVQLWYTTPSEYSRSAALVGWWLAGVLLALDAVVFLGGLQLRRPQPSPAAQATDSRTHRHLLPLVVYLGAGIWIGLLAALASISRSDLLRPLGFLLVQPWFLFQLIFGGLLGNRIGGTPMSHAVTVGWDVFYFVAFFYQVYSMITMDRAVEKIRYRRMKILLALFGSIHLLIALFLLAASKA